MSTTYAVKVVTTNAVGVRSNLCIFLVFKFIFLVVIPKVGCSFLSIYRPVLKIPVAIGSFKMST